MTARDHLRVDSRRLRRDRAPIEAAPAPRLGEVLQLARERKGVDLYRAERDTKIRLRYLAALEDGDFSELPAPVYTKGFLRNYAIYLGLDPDELLARWHAEMAALNTRERVAVAPPPQPLTAPRTLIRFTPATVVTGLVVLVVIAFVGYVALQIARYATTPEIGLTYPPSMVSEIDANQVTLSGTAAAGSVVTITTPDSHALQTIADEQGAWAQPVDLARGRNDFTIVANDPVTRRDSPPLRVIITVPLPGASASPATNPGDLSLELTAPADNMVSTDGQVLVSGSTNGSGVSLRAQWLGPPGGSPAPSPTPDGQSPAPTPTSPPPQQLSVGPSGVFSTVLQLEPGLWRIDLTAFTSGLSPRTASRQVIVTGSQATPPPEGPLNVVLTISGGQSWVRIVADGTPVPKYKSRTLRAGSTHTFTAQHELYIRAGNAGVIRVTVNGVDMGVLGPTGKVGNWLIIPGQPPQQTTQRQ
jgi:cytoskeletal protein RodZ